MIFSVLQSPISFLILILHLCGLLLAFPALLYTRTPQGSIAWVISLVFFPYLAIPLYLVLGPRRFDGYIRMRRAYLTENEHLRGETWEIIHSLHEPHDPDQGERTELFDSLYKIGNLPVCHGNSCKLLIDGDAAYAEMSKAIIGAKDYIFVEFYILKNDKVGSFLHSQLIQKAKEGVRVYVVYDEIGSHKLPWRYVSTLRQAGVHIQPFNGKRFFLRNIVSVNFRNHRKIVIVDGKICFIGGMNIGQDYIGEGEMGYWRDTFMRLSGPAVLQTQAIFIEDWRWATDGDVPEAFWDHAEVSPENTDVMMLSSGPADQFTTWRDAVICLSNAAKKRLWIASPYFVPDDATLSALQMAALRGVDVRVLLPEKADHQLVKLATFTFLPESIPYGVQIFHYTKGFMHQKVLLVDDDISAVGTANLDNRSLTLNFELTAIMPDKKMAEKVSHMLSHDFQEAKSVSLASYTEQNLIFKIACNIARLMAPVQ
jgi:cardiolipin synthase